MRLSGVWDQNNYSNITNENILKKYPDVLNALNYKPLESKLICEGRVLRRDRERIKKIKRIRKQPFACLKQFENALFDAKDNKPNIFSCPVCRNVLKAPITVECGHTFCAECMKKGLYDKCSKCFTNLSEHKPSINILVQTLVEKWRERNKSNRVDIPLAVDILGLHPRYTLRSGYAGLQFTNKNDGTTFFDYNYRYHNKKGYKSRYKPKERNCRHGSQRRNNNHKYLDRLYRDNEKEIDQFKTSLNNIFKEVNDIKEKAIRTSWNVITPEDLECILCSRCFLDPVTTSCGHTFCRDCLTRVLDHRLTCPLCMSSLEVSDYFKGSTEVLDQAIRFLIPDEHDTRLLNNNMEYAAVIKNADIPVFVCTNAFPGVACPLYVYEPRYRLLIRRCLLSPAKKFAMASKDPESNKFVPYGTILEIKDAIMLEDGRVILTTLGSRRFRVVSKSEQDGYDTAQIEHIKDVHVLLENVPELVFLHQKVYNKAGKWIQSLKPKVLSEVERLIGKMPKIENDWIHLPDGPSWTWWLMPILPLSSQLQVGFLITTSLEKRLRAIDKMLEHMNIKMKTLKHEETVTCSSQEEQFDFCGESHQRALTNQQQ